MKMKRYSIEDDVRRLQIELAHIAELRVTTKTDGWKHVVKAFNQVIGEFLQEVLNKCDKPEKYALEIRCKKMVADALGKILATIDNRVSREQHTKEQLDHKSAHYAEMMDRQKLQRL